ncbi:adenine nucleotide alpha hydrolase [Hamiltosporidium tvaerminnensis]|uniref:Adenine nucleotide alpha hydrolase n=3 Tax=Hamiltosporidium TaxID=1176354 RepID=A0A4Q9L1V2_9MICR|nr:cytosolic thiouridylase subunit Ctu1 [Hamiltosporidium tvaerminnensis]TBT98601.1 adenine nucleotide alpha hydrolase [Hamiltosporidium tvaerminnensis]TBU01066.1 adenine nucleotide alpha hydrolase [Hamiltosporidium magnivora]
MLCFRCNLPAQLIRSKDLSKVCKKCFINIFEEEIHQTILESKMFVSGEKICVAVSGGKDSTVLLHVINILNERHSYNIDLLLLSADEGIKNYREFSLEKVYEAQKDTNLEMKVVEYKKEFGYTMDEIVKKVGVRNSCTYCGMLRRQALNIGSADFETKKILMGHNADDLAETVLMNILRGDTNKLRRCTNIILSGTLNTPFRCRPLKYAYEKEIVMYAFYKKLNYFSEECTYAKESFRGEVRVFLKELEKIRPSIYLDLIRTGEYFEKSVDTVKSCCTVCGDTSNVSICKRCVWVETIKK